MSEHSELTEFERKQIVNALEHILATDKFVAAPQMSAFLRYVVEQSISGNKNRIKAYTVAVDALGKPDTFDPQNDPVVRVLAGRLRSSLGNYYKAHPQTSVVIQMKPGSYVPIFVNHQHHNKSNDETADTVTPASDEKTLLDRVPGNISSSDTRPVNNDAVAAATLYANNATASPQATDPALGQTDQTDVGTSDLGVAPVEDTLHSDTTSRQIQSTNSAKRNLFASFYSRFGHAPKAILASGILALTILVTYLSLDHRDEEPVIQAASPLHSTMEIQRTERTRPDHLSIFVSAVDEGNPLENQLNSMMSGVFSESEQVRVYRILDSTSHYRFWPEDYVLSLEVMSLPSETQIGVQLMAAQTGRISYSDTLVLSEMASESLTHEELDLITTFSRNLINDDGPLVNDYRSLDSGNALQTTH